jgi:hypothetical protein
VICTCEKHSKRNLPEGNIDSDPFDVTLRCAILIPEESRANKMGNSKEIAFSVSTPVQAGANISIIRPLHSTQSSLTSNFEKRLTARMRFLSGCLSFSGRAISMVLVLSFVATIPVLQFASLGYILESSGRVARGEPWGRCFPGVKQFGLIVRCAVWVFLTWLPVWFLTDLGYSSELIQPGSVQAARLRTLARAVSILWVLWVAWAIARGGRWYHFLWPQPIRFAKKIFSFDFWRELESRWWDFLVSLEFWRLWKLGFKASVGALIWLAIPALAILIALNGASQVQPQQQGGLALLGLFGALGMAWVLQYLPGLQIQLARQSPSSQQRLGHMWERKEVRAAFLRAPLSFALAQGLFYAMSIPLYVLRIEKIPEQLWFGLAIVFVTAMFPAKLLLGWAWRNAQRRENSAHWALRWIAWVPMLGAIGVYIGFLYLGKFTAWEGGASLLLQHAFLPPVPFYIR